MTNTADLYSTYHDIATSIIGVLLGIPFLAISITMLSDIPARQDIIWLNSFAIKKVDEIKSDGAIKGLRFESDSDCCVYINSDTQGFGEVLDAHHREVDFLIGYVKSKAIFSSGPKRYVMILDIQIDGKHIKSYDDYVSALKKIFSFIGIFGLIVLYYSYHQFKNFRSRTAKHIGHAG